MTSIASEYRAAHRRIDEIRLPAKYHDCAWCLLTADQWAYLHNDPHERSEDGRVWSEHSANYVAMCRSCHKQFDHAYRRVGREGLAEAIAPLITAAYASVNPERRSVEAEAREASIKAAHAFLIAQDKGLGNRYGKVPIEVQRQTRDLLVRAYASGPPGMTTEHQRQTWMRWAADY
ncbi:hypothetical protein AB0J30_15245 [Streptomyces microflavus]|uniref:hypothetical protein n=1 Tax=Streptomyces microflavus TaxID=1919 RepID=UPI003432ED47